jgi:hypothetical protein
VSVAALGLGTPGEVAQTFAALRCPPPEFAGPTAAESDFVATIVAAPGLTAPVFTPAVVDPVPAAGEGRVGAAAARVAAGGADGGAWGAVSSCPVTGRPAVAGSASGPLALAGPAAVEPDVVPPSFGAASVAVPVLTVAVRTVTASRAPKAVAPNGGGGDIASLSGVTRTHRVPTVAGAAAEALPTGPPAVVEPDGAGPAGPAEVAGGGQPGEVSGGVVAAGRLGAVGRVWVDVCVSRGAGRVLVACGVSRFVMVVPPRCAGVPNALWRCAGYARFERAEPQSGVMSLERGGTGRGRGFRRTVLAAMIGSSIVNPR